MNAVIRLCLTLTVAACSACSHATYFSPACANPELDSVPTANNSRVLIGTYGERQARDAHGGRRHVS